MVRERLNDSSQSLKRGYEIKEGEMSRLNGECQKKEKKKENNKKLLQHATNKMI